MTRDALAVIDTAMHAAGGTADHTWLKGTYDISHKENRKLYVKEMMQAEDEGNAKLYKVIRNDLLTKGGMSEDDIDQKINEILNDRLDDMGIDIPAAAEALDPGKKESINEFQRQVQTYIEVKARAGWDKEKCLQTIRTSLTNEFKPKWKAAKTQKERDDVIRQCNRLIYKGKPLYSGYDFSKWRD